MKIQPGDLFLSEEGHYYRVIDAQSNSVSLKRLDGYTLFSCRPPFVEASFRRVLEAKGT
ncbi:hypothetical protein [Neosynechococcus sphagnicola]|uniref:hypothetical protein n=1 Tax=Neosynechococcus sphagnicola TaxID=1501145 RepID=UPI0012E0B00A|nr:hypothetical protein [Neosynechococcus sphagnicola]